MSVVFSKYPPKNHLSIIVDAGKFVSLCVIVGSLCLRILGRTSGTARERDFGEFASELTFTLFISQVYSRQVCRTFENVVDAGHNPSRRSSTNRPYQYAPPGNEKVPLSNYDYDQLLSGTWQMFALYSNDDLQKLFRRSEREKAVNIIHALIPVLFRDPPEEGGTEASYHFMGRQYPIHTQRHYQPRANKSNPRQQPGYEYSPPETRFWTADGRLVHVQRRGETKQLHRIESKRGAYEEVGLDI